MRILILLIILNNVKIIKLHKGCRVLWRIAMLHSESTQVALNWDLSQPIDYLVNRKHMDKTHVETMAREYRRFLGIIATHPTYRFPISDPVDEMWHTHILFTEDYMDMSNAVRGSYIGHKPVLTEDERQSIIPHYLEGTLKQYELLYGEKPRREWWPTDGAICWCGQVH